MNTPIRKAVLIAALMGCAALIGTSLKPTHKIADDRPKVTLETLVPTNFGDWHVQQHSTGVVANPQSEILLNKLYNQIISRTYMNSRGQAIMLSIAYGEDQRDGMQLHYPEVCYPAQGFQVKTNAIGTIQSRFGSIPVRRLETSVNDRYEPVTYWTTVGNMVTLGGIDKKLVEMKYGLRGLIADGLLFRVSSIDRDSAEAFQVQEQFVRELIAQVSPQMRIRLAGLQ